MWRPVTPEFTTPYAPAIVVLDEGYQMVTNVINTDVDQLAIDLPLSVTFERAGEVWLPYFQPSSQSQLAAGDPSRR